MFSTSLLWKIDRMPIWKAGKQAFGSRPAGRPQGTALAFVWSACGGWLWNLSGRCLFPVQFCWLSKLKCRSDTFTSSHPSLCIVFVRTSVHLRVDPIWSCISPDRPTRLQKACQSRDLNIDSSENASANADGWNYTWSNWKSMSMSPQNNFQVTNYVFLYNGAGGE